MIKARAMPRLSRFFDILQECTYHSFAARKTRRTPAHAKSSSHLRANSADYFRRPHRLAVAQRIRHLRRKPELRVADRSEERRVGKEC